MRSDVVISVKNLTKTYRIFGHPGDRIKQALTFGQKQFHKEFTALKDVSFEIKKGETVGIIGRNGSGKSTLLQLVCGILKPTSGSVEVNGRISALLELGAGFNPEFTGRENVYFQGAVLGISKEEMVLRFDDIAAFADIGEFIDQPVRTYSSGMFVRLAFAVAIHVDPQILVVDEALAVGDAIFQAKCFQHIKSIQKAGGSILLVTHVLEQVGHFCDRVLILDGGNLLADGNASETLTLYTKKALNPERHPLDSRALDDPFSSHSFYNAKETRWGDRAAVITDACLIQNKLTDPEVFSSGLKIELTIKVIFRDAVDQPVYGLTIKTADGAQLFTMNSRQSPSASPFRSQKAGNLVKVCFRFQPFLDSGDYLISVGVAGDTESGLVPHDRRYDSIFLRIAHPMTSSGEIAMNPSVHILD
ncbi:ABC transporter ATP-binding protein [Rhodoferax sp.]|uniref:ABC transporter ATP-binding protein n=1 Tax=Rhodoferax sp. TaxID=50421 RepID=UPI00262E41D4|nr:ABC transporter ATP-binding protein [Rhodoferax sp.]MDD2920300.1 ABC transporter ATP-binding protein [Rhodoferax sp.]